MTFYPGTTGPIADIAKAIAWSAEQIAGATPAAPPRASGEMYSIINAIIYATNNITGRTNEPLKQRPFGSTYQIVEALHYAGNIMAGDAANKPKCSYVNIGAIANAIIYMADSLASVPGPSYTVTHGSDLKDIANAIAETTNAITKGSNIKDARKQLSMEYRPIARALDYFEDVITPALPKLIPIDWKKPITLKALTTPNKHGYILLDSPRFWEHSERIFRALERAGETIGKALWLTPNKDKDPYLAIAARHGKITQVLTLLHEQNDPLAKVDLLEIDGSMTPLLNTIISRKQLGPLLKHLNQNGEGLHTADLLNTDRTPNRLLKAIIDNKQVAALFREDNWRGQTVADARRLYKALPESIQPQVANYHTLLANLARTPSAHTPQTQLPKQAVYVRS